MGRSYFHLHLVSDSTGETLIAASRAAAAQYQGVASIEHVYPLVRTRAQLERVVAEIENAPGIVLFTLVDPDLSRRLEAACEESGSPCLSVLGPMLNLFQSYLGQSSTPRAGAQHMLNSGLFQTYRRAELHHDVRRRPVDGDAGAAPTSCCSASAARRRRRRASISPIAAIKHRQHSAGAATCRCRAALEHLRRPLIVGLVASPDRIVQIRQNRLLALQRRSAKPNMSTASPSREEIADSRRLFAERNWPIIDVSRRSIEETAAAILDLYREHNLKFIALG